jgi:nuclear cap-binding protein subunit 1
VKTFDFGAELVQQLHARLQEALDTADGPRVRLLVRFVGELVNANVLPPASLVSLLDRLLEAALDAHAQPAETAAAAYSRGDMLAHAVVGVLPFVGRELHERRQKDLTRLLSLLDSYVARRPPLDPRHAPALAPATDALMQQWHLVGAARDSHFVTAALPRPFKAFEGRLNLALQHTLAPVDVPPLAAALRYVRAPPAMSLFPDSALKPLDRVLIDMYVADLLHLFHQRYVCPLAFPFRTSFADVSPSQSP